MWSRKREEATFSTAATGTLNVICIPQGPRHERGGCDKPVLFFPYFTLFFCWVRTGKGGLESGRGVPDRESLAALGCRKSPRLRQVYNSLPSKETDKKRCCCASNPVTNLFIVHRVEGRVFYFSYFIFHVFCLVSEKRCAEIHLWSCLTMSRFCPTIHSQVSVRVSSWRNKKGKKERERGRKKGSQ